MSRVGATQAYFFVVGENPGVYTEIVHIINFVEQDHYHYVEKHLLKFHSLVICKRILAFFQVNCWLKYLQSRLYLGHLRQ